MSKIENCSRQLRAVCYWMFNIFLLVLVIIHFTLHKNRIMVVKSKEGQENQKNRKKELISEVFALLNKESVLNALPTNIPSHPQQAQHAGPPSARRTTPLRDRTHN